MDSAPPEPTARPLSFLGAAGWALLVAILFETAASATEALHPGALGDIVSVATCKLLAYSVVLFAMVRFHDPEGSLRRVFALRRTGALVVVLAVVAGAALAPGAMWLEELFARRFPPPAADLESIQRLLAVPTAEKKVGLVVSLVVVLPVFDELFFRGALFTLLKRGRRADVVVLATAAFDTLLAASARETASLLVTVLAIACMRALSGSVAPAIGARVAFFAVQVVPLAIDRELRPPGIVVAASTVVAAGAVLAIAGLCRRDPRAAAARAQDA